MRSCPHGQDGQRRCHGVRHDAARPLRPLLVLLLWTTVCLTLLPRIGAAPVTAPDGAAVPASEPAPPIAADTTLPTQARVDAAWAEAEEEGPHWKPRGAPGRVSGDGALYQHFLRQRTAAGGAAGGTTATATPPLIEEKDVVAATPSWCGARSGGCPRSAMVWASGSFTVPALLTASTLLTEANATLQLSLCCGYRYDGRVLRDAALYSHFLTELLQASPFQALSPVEQGHLFPRERALVIDSRAGRVHHHHHHATVHGDGDGDVLVLVTGRLSAAAVERVYLAAATPLTHARQGQPAGDGERPPASSDHESERQVLSADIQLRITNRILKCKCPHTLLVMPLLRLRPDALPPVRVLGVGPHCGEQRHSDHVRRSTPPPHSGAADLQRTPHRHLIRIAGPAGVEGEFRYATTFLTAPALPPLTRVTWTMDRLGGRGGPVRVLRHTRTLAIRLERDPETGEDRAQLTHAPSPYVVVEPHVRYRVHLRAERAGGGLVSEGEGDFILRLPFRRTWPLPVLPPQPHFGFQRRLRLHPGETMVHPEVRHALAPRGPAGAGTGSGTSATPGHVYDYYGYWENAPLADQPLPQHYVHRMYNPFAANATTPAGPKAAPSTSPTVTFPLFHGRNLLHYAVQDVDKVCEPVPLEEREYWAVQSIIATGNPSTACGPTQPVEAMRVHHLLHTMREQKRFAVNVPGTTWAPMDVAEPGREGNYSCRTRALPGRQPASGTAGRPTQPIMYDGTCGVTTTFPGGVSGTTALLHLERRGVYDVEWVVHVAVADPHLLESENMDEDVASISRDTAGAERATATSTAGVEGASPDHHGTAAAPPGPVVVVHIRSRVLHVARRVSSYPPRAVVQLPMHARRLTVLPPTPLQASMGGRVAGAGEGESPAGYWVTRRPLLTRSVDEHHRLELDTSSVPNVQRVLPNATLVFVAQDPGEDLAAAYGIAYTSRCPDTLVEHVVSVVAMPAPPVVPAYVPVYTEDDCVVLEPPRPARKDEVVEWRVQSCPEANSALRIIERAPAAGEGHRGAAAGGDVPQPAAVGVRVQACGIPVHARCEVHWTATNLVATVTQTFSLRRCQRPPAVLFHKNGLQHPSRPASPLFPPLPTVTEEYDAGAEGGDGDGPRTPRVLQRTRTIIPVAGDAVELGYSFNYTAGLQNQFETTMRPLPGEAANELLYTASHSPYPASMHEPGQAEEVSGIVWRRRDRYELSTDVRSTGQAPATGPRGGEGWPSSVAGAVGVHRGEGVVDELGLDDDIGEEAEAEEGGMTTGTDWWEAYHRHRAHAPASVESSSLDAYVVRGQAERRQRRLQRRNAALDKDLNARATMRHAVERRELVYEQLGNASLHPMDYVVRASAHQAPRSAALAEDQREFQRRGMCTAHVGRTALLAISPLGVVHVDRRLPPPPAPALAVLPFCTPRLIFSRHPHLHSVYGYDFTWSCEDGQVLAVEKLAPTYSVLTHVEDRSASGGRSPPPLRWRNETNCRLTVHNRLTDTTRADWLLLRRVYPSPPAFQHFTILSDGAAALPRGQGGGHEEVDGRRAGLPRARLVTRRVYGKRVVLHVDHLSRDSRDAYWGVVSVVPALTPDTPTAASPRQVMDTVRFTRLPHHPAARARGGGGSTVLVTGLDTPGLYTIAHVMPDPVNPGVCPNVTLTETLEVLHAQVRERELVVCGSTAALRAVPIPRELAGEFVGVWEVVSLQTAEDEVWTAGVNFTGIRLERGRRADTLVHGLPFGIVTVRWAIYRTSQGRDGDGEGGGGGSSQDRRVLVDYDTVRVLVLTENLHTNRLVTLADTANVLTTSSTVGWHVTGRGEDVAAHTSSPLPTLREHALLNHSALVYTAGAEGVSGVDPALLPYYGPVPRRGAGLLTVSGLSVGTMHLGYTLRPSVNVFGPMIGHTCELPASFELERVAAFLTAETTLDHECDAYAGEGVVTLCLHAHTARPLGGKAGSAAATASTRSRVKGEGRTRWESHLRLIDPATMEEVVKAGARELAEAGCATPWWVWPSTVWGPVQYAQTEAMSAPGRCVRFTVAAGRHLAPREVSHPLFLATPAPRSRRADSGGGGRRGPSDPPISCGHGDFITSLVIDGAGGGAPAMARGDDGGGGGGGAAAAAAVVGSGTDRGLLSRLYRGGGAGSVSTPPVSVRGTHRWGAGGPHHYLPILSTATMQRDAMRGMRPMVGMQGLADEVTHENSVSRGNESVVTLHLDLSQPHRLGGYVARTLLESLAVGTAHDPRLLRVPRRRSLLLACAEDGAVRAGDVLTYWTETNRPDGATDGAAVEWLQYVQQVREARVPCDVLFPSLHHLLASARERLGADGGAPAIAAAPALSREGPPAVTSGAGADPLASEAGKARRLVTLATVEEQLRRIQAAHTWTRDGIDVTGLREELQDALRRRRVTRAQLKEIAEARQVRLAQERTAAVEQQQQHDHDHEPSEAAGPSIVVSQRQRLLDTIELYRSVAAAGAGVDREVIAAVRIRLPRLESFTVPYDLYMRTALHKDILCGTNLTATRDFATPLVAVPTPNPYSLVTMGRLAIADEPAALALQPSTVKQCEVEGHMPVLRLNVTGARFAKDAFTADQVLLEEIANPELPEKFLQPVRGHVRGAVEAVGLQPCLPELRAGMEAVVVRDSQKQLHIRLGACPTFRMLAEAEYNERQRSEDLLHRLRYPRLLRVTVRDALSSDSFTTTTRVDRAAGPVTAPVEGLGQPQSPPPPARHDNHSESWESERVGPPMAARGGPAPLPGVPPSPPAQRRTRDIVFVVAIAPTLARLHLRHDEGGRDGPGAASLTEGRPLHRTAARPLILCERDMRMCGFELGVELIGDRWSPSVGEEGEPGTGAHRERDGEYPHRYRDRGAANVALLNSFSPVEHHTLDSVRQHLLRGAGVYRSHFVYYLFSTVLANPRLQQHHRFIRRHNDSFVSLTVPPQPHTPARRAAVGASGSGGSSHTDRARHQLASLWLEHVDAEAMEAAGATTTTTITGYELPAVRRFNRVEEILLAVPGIATECHGCLLADTTFFVAGDLTGVWSLPNHPTAALHGGGGPEGVSLTHAVLAGPLVVPWHTAAAVPREWRLHWLCQSGARPALEAVQHAWATVQAAHARDRGRPAESAHRSSTPTSRDGAASLGEATVHVEVVAYTRRAATGGAAAAAPHPLPTHRQVVLLASEPVPLPRLLHPSAWRGGGGTGEGVHFHVSERAAEAAYTTVAADYLLHRRPGAATLTPAFSYGQSGASAGGLTVVNASVLVKVCVPLDGEEERQGRDGAATRPRPSCILVSATDSLLTVEAPRVERRRRVSRVSDVVRALVGLSEPSPSPSLQQQRRLRGDGVGGRSLWKRVAKMEVRHPRASVALPHHLLLALLFYLALPMLAVELARCGRDERFRGRDGAEREAEARRLFGLTYAARSLSGLPADPPHSRRRGRGGESGGDEAAAEARVAFSVMFLVLLIFAHAYVPVVWVALALGLWSYILYKARNGLVLALFVGYMVYWHLLL